MTKTETNFYKQKQIKVKIKDRGTFSLTKGESVLSMLRKDGGITFSHCGGNGVCGKCVVRFLSGAPLPLPADRRRFSAEELREGYRLACLAKPQTDCELECYFPKETMKIVTTDLSDGAKEPGGKKNNNQDAGNNETGKQENGSIGAEPGETYVAIDLGTTTIVMQLIEKATGKVIDTYAKMNPQRNFGTDVISRMQHSIAGERQQLKEAVCDCLSQGMHTWIMAGFDIKLAFLAGNTVMIHLLQGYHVEKLAFYPFVPKTLEEQKIEICGITTVIIPGISAFVGGDILAGILTCVADIRPGGEKTTLLVDLGTNGEMALIHHGKVYVTATAAGPAFEGGATAGVYGADIIAITAKLVEKDIVDATGLLHQNYFDSGITWQGVHLTQKDIRNLQMAKAAVFAGIEILLSKAGIDADQVEKVYLAGGFGYYLDVHAACKIGVLPMQWENRIKAIGNAALAGAVLYGREYEKQKAQAVKIRQTALAINLAEEPAFESTYLDSMELTGKNPFARDAANDCNSSSDISFML